jgi:hypothetical protein
LKALHHILSFKRFAPGAFNVGFIGSTCTALPCTRACVRPSPRSRAWQKLLAASKRATLHKTETRVQIAMNDVAVDICQGETFPRVYGGTRLSPWPRGQYLPGPTDRWQSPLQYFVHTQLVHDRSFAPSAGGFVHFMHTWDVWASHQGLPISPILAQLQHHPGE